MDTKRNIYAQHNIKHVFEANTLSILPLFKKKKKSTQDQGTLVLSIILLNLTVPDFLKKYKKGIDRNIFFFKECITANTSEIWQHAIHTASQLTPPRCKTRAMPPKKNRKKESIFQRKILENFLGEQKSGEWAISS